MGDAAVWLKGVTRRFGRLVAVDELDLCVQPGQVMGLLGPNGSGKSTTLRMILGMLVPHEGDLAVLGGPPDLSVRRRIGYLPEQRGLYDQMPVRDQIAWFGRLHDVPRREALRRADRWLELLGLEDRGRARLDELSKGMQQRVQLGVALIAEPELVVLDEPFSGLDPVSQEVFADVVRQERARGAAVLLCTHELSQAQRACDEVTVLIQGVKRLGGSVRSLRRAAGAGRVRLAGLSREAVEAAGLVVGREEDDAVEVLAPSEGGAEAVLRRLVAAGLTPERFEVAAPSLHEVVVREIKDWDARVEAA